MMLSTERRERQQADNAAATERKRIAVAKMDKAGLCRRCGKADRDDGLTSCTPCRDRINVARTGRTIAPRVRSAPVDAWCMECIACGFHRSDCKLTRTP
jgi:hypothetical protein